MFNQSLIKHKNYNIYKNIVYIKKENKWIFEEQTDPICFDRITNDENLMFKTEQPSGNINLEKAQIIEEPYILHRYNYPTCLWHIFIDGLLPTHYLGNFLDANYKILKTTTGETRTFNNPNFATPYNSWQPWLDLLGKKTTHLESIDSDIVVFKNLLVGFITPNIITNFEPHFLKFKQTILESLNIKISKDPQKILFLNRKINRRSIINHKEITEYLTSKNIIFEYAEFENVPFKEQVEKIVNCKILIGPEGAGLFHSCFMKDESRLIAVYPKNYKKKTDCWEKLSRWSGNYFVYIQAEKYKHEKHCCDWKHFEELKKLNPDNPLINNYEKIVFDNPIVRGIDGINERSRWLMKHLVKNQNMEVDPEKIYQAIVNS